MSKGRQNPNPFGIEAERRKEFARAKGGAPAGEGVRAGDRLISRVRVSRATGSSARQKPVSRYPTGMLPLPKKANSRYTA